jgi:hypothetical protein
LIFQSPIAAVVSGNSTLVSFNSTDYYTKAQTDAAIAAAIAAGSTPAAVLSLGTHSGINLHLILPFQHSGSVYYLVNPSQTGSFNQTSDKIQVDDWDNLFPVSGVDRTTSSSVTISGHLLEMPDAQTMSTILPLSPWPEPEWFWSSLSTSAQHHQIVFGSTGAIYSASGNGDQNHRFSILKVS